MRPSHILTLAGSLLVASSLAFAQAPAGPTDPVQLAEHLNKKALDDYDNLEFDSAKQTLEQAIVTLRGAGQDNTATAAKVHANLGMMYFTADHDQSRALRQLKEALKIDGTVHLDPSRATPELQALFDQALQEVPPAERGTPPAPAPVETPTTPGEVHGLVVTPIDEAPFEHDLVVHARMGKDVDATRLFLFFRAEGQADFVLLPMTVDPNGEWSGTIPAEATIGRTVQFYVEARDAQGRPAVSSGSDASPFIVTLTGLPENHKRPVYDNPLANLKRKQLTKNRGYGHIFVNLMLGTGLGIEPAGNHYEVAYEYSPTLQRYQPLTVKQAGIATSPLHGALEIGGNINRHIAVSALLRVEGTLFNNAESADKESRPLGKGILKAPAAIASLARVRYNFGEGRLWPSVHVGIGGGQIRHVLNISDANSAKYPLVDSVTAKYYASSNPYGGAKPTINQVCLYKKSCYDNITIGYLLAAVGGGVYYDLVKFRNGGFGVLADASLIFAFGDQFGVNLDIQAGFGGHFF